MWLPDLLTETGRARWVLWVRWVLWSLCRDVGPWRGFVAVPEDLDYDQLGPDIRAIVHPVTITARRSSDRCQCLSGLIRRSAIRKECRPRRINVRIPRCPVRRQHPRRRRRRLCLSPSRPLMRRPRRWCRRRSRVHSASIRSNSRVRDRRSSAREE